MEIDRSLEMTAREDMTIPTTSHTTCKVTVPALDNTIVESHHLIRDTRAVEQSERSEHEGDAL
jgi:hypothetical protein